MSFKLRLRTFWAVLVVLSVLWVANVFGFLLYSVVFPKPDFQDIVYALEERGTPPPKISAALQGMIASFGLLQRTVQVSYYTGVTATFQLNASHTTRKTQAAYLAWFQNRPKPKILLINRDQTDGGALNYDIEVNEVENWGIARSRGLPVLALAFSVFMFRRRRTPLLDDEPSKEAVSL